MKYVALVLVMQIVIDILPYIKDEVKHCNTIVTIKASKKVG